MSNFLSNLGNLNPSNLLPWISETYKKEQVQKALFLTGLAYASWNVLSYTSKVTSYLFTHEHNLIARYGVDSWAVITGASDGIGKEFAIQLAHRGFNLILVARNEDKLGVVRAEITAKHPNIRIRNIVADFAKSAEDGFYENIFNQVSDLDISLLVNNVGAHISDEFHLIPTSEVRDLVLVNCLSQALMTRVFLPKLLGRMDGKVKSGIIDISSVSALHPSPYAQVYGATKVFNDYLSQGLSYEYPELDVLCLKPGYVASNMTSKIIDLDKAISPREFVEAGLKYLGNSRVSVGHWKHQLGVAIGGVLPRRVLNNAIRQTEWGHVQKRKESHKQIIS